MLATKALETIVGHSGTMIDDVLKISVPRKPAIAGWGVWMILASAWMTAFSEMLGDLLSTSKVGHKAVARMTVYEAIVR